MDQNTENVQIDIKYHQIYQEGCRRLILRLLCHFLNHFAVVFGLKHLHAIDFVITSHNPWSPIANSRPGSCVLPSVKSRSCRCSSRRLECLADQPPNALLTVISVRVHPLRKSNSLAFSYSVLAYIFFGSSVARGVPDCLKYQLQAARLLLPSLIQSCSSLHNTLRLLWLQP